MFITFYKIGKKKEEVQKMNFHDNFNGVSKKPWQGHW